MILNTINVIEEQTTYMIKSNFSYLIDIYTSSKWEMNFLGQVEVDMFWVQGLLMEVHPEPHDNFNFDIYILVDLLMSILSVSISAQIC